MSHPAHFLTRLRRVEPDQVRFALLLYHDSALVRALLAQLTLPEGCERVAIAIERAEASPHLILTRQGRFVTCLAAGMQVHDCPIITRDALEQVREVRERLSAALARVEGEDPDPWAQPLGVGGRVSQEQLAPLLAIAPLLWPRAFMLLDDQQRALAGARDEAMEQVREDPHRVHQRRPRALLDYWEPLHALGHLGVMIGCAHQETRLLAERHEGFRAQAVFHDFSHAIVREGHVGQTLRVMWAVARHAELLTPLYVAQLEAAESTTSVLDAVMALLAIAGRNPGLAGDVRAQIERHIATSGDGVGAAYRQAIAPLALLALPELDAAGAQREALLERLRRVIAGALHRHGAGPYAEHVKDPGSIPRAALLACACHSDVCFRNAPAITRSLLPLVTEVANLSATDLYMPADLEARVYAGWDLRVVTRFVAHLAGDAPQTGFTPAPGAPIGRNAPCPCGSGRKYKHCCGRKR